MLEVLTLSSVSQAVAMPILSHLSSDDGAALPPLPPLLLALLVP